MVWSGLQSPGNQNQEPNDGKDDETKKKDVNENGQLDDEQAKGEQSVLEIDGEKYDEKRIKEMREGYLRQSDYTRKTQALAEERKQLEEERMKINELIADLQRQSPSDDDSDDDDSDKKLKKLFSRLDNLEEQIVQVNQSKIEEQKIEQETKLLNQEIKEMQDKYPLMDKQAVLAGIISNPEADIEQLAKKSHNRINEMKANWEKEYQEKLKKNKMAKVEGGGGKTGTGKPPKLSLKDGSAKREAERRIAAAFEANNY